MICAAAGVAPIALAVAAPERSDPAPELVTLNRPVSIITVPQPSLLRREQSTYRLLTSDPRREEPPARAGKIGHEIETDMPRALVQTPYEANRDALGSGGGRPLSGRFTLTIAPGRGSYWPEFGVVGGLFGALARIYPSVVGEAE